MKIKFNKVVELEVVTDYDEDRDETITEDEFFKKGDEVEADLLSSTSATISIQFGDGSCCYGIPKDCFEVLELDEDEEV